MKTFFSFIFFIVFVFSFFSIPQTVSARIYADDITATINPSNPGPNQTISITLQAYSTNLDTDTITWTINGKRIQSGTALKSLTTKTGGMGTETRISILINDPSGESVEKIITLAPTQIDLIWEADSYTPPFYKGKALYPHQGFVRITALPIFIGTNGNKIAPSNLIYKWRKDNFVLGSLSGYGKQTLDTQGAVMSDPIKISVEISTLDGKMKGSQQIILNPQYPELIFYQDSALYGTIYENALGTSHTMNEREVSITAAPYYFNGQDKNSYNFKYTWGVNNTKVDGSTATKIFRQVTNDEGRSEISLRIENTDKLLQFVKNSITLNFNKIEE